jgi:hypothetical protein
MVRPSLILSFSLRAPSVQIAKPVCAAALLSNRSAPFPPPRQASAAEPVDPKPAADKACHTPCIKAWVAYEACTARIAAKGEGTCEPWAQVRRRAPRLRAFLARLRRACQPTPPVLFHPRPRAGLLALRGQVRRTHDFQGAQVGGAVARRSRPLKTNEG